VERYNRKLVRQLRCYVAEHQTDWGSHLSHLPTAHKTQVDASTGEIPFAFKSPSRLQLFGMERIPLLRQPEERTDDAVSAAKQYVDDLKALIHAVRRQMGKAQATYKRAFAARTKEKNNSVKAGDWVYLDSHSRSLKKLGFKTEGPFLVLQTDGHWFLVERPTGLCKVNSDHVTGAPAPQEPDAKWTRALRIEALFKMRDQNKDGPEFVFERFFSHGRDDQSQLKLLLKWFEFLEKDATWQLASSLPRDAVRKYCSRKHNKSTPNNVGCEPLLRIIR